MASKLPFLNLPLSPTPDFQRLHLIPRKIVPAVLPSAANPTLQHSSASWTSSFQSFNVNRTQSFLSLEFQSENSNPIRSSLVVRSTFNSPLISPDDRWGTWTALFAAGAFGIWSEKTKIGSALSGALVSTLVGLAASNLGIISFDSPAYAIVLKFLLPVAVPLLLFRADLRRVVQSTGRLLLAFLIGSGHFGRDKTLSLIQGSFFWPHMVRQIKRCKICHIAKMHSKNTCLYTPLPVSEAPWVDMSMNFVVGNHALKGTKILSWLCHSLKW